MSPEIGSMGCRSSVRRLTSPMSRQASHGVPANRAVSWWGKMTAGPCEPASATIGRSQKAPWDNIWDNNRQISRLCPRGGPNGGVADSPQ